VTPGSSGVPCPHYPRCDGCPLVGQPYTEQLRHKQGAVETALADALGPGSVEVLRIIGSRAPFGYRNQAKMVLKRTRAGVVAGLYAPGTHRVVDARACPVHHPAINRILAAATALLTEHDISIYDEREAQGALRYLVVRYSFWLRQAQVILVSTERPPALAGFIRVLRRRCRDVQSVVLNLNADRGNVIFGSQWIPVGGPAGIVDRMGTLKLHVSAGSFLQANPWVAGRLYRLAGRWVAGHADETVVDLYAGVGGIALTVAPDVRRVYAVEENPSATADSRSNARRNGISNVRALNGSVEELIEQLRHDLGACDVVTINPPRTGVPPDVLAGVAALRPRALLYLSCRIETLARDLARLRAYGYATRRVQPADMLPQTEHVECLALVERV
jgi:23S rRNA (uracil1939-C5)-methyltransferase